MMCCTWGCSRTSFESLRFDIEMMMFWNTLVWFEHYRSSSWMTLHMKTMRHLKVCTRLWFPKVIPSTSLCVCVCSQFGFVNTNVKMAGFRITAEMFVLGNYIYITVKDRKRALTHIARSFATVTTQITLWHCQFTTQWRPSVLRYVSSICYSD
jgi:hypothetical protein